MTLDIRIDPRGWSRSVRRGVVVAVETPARAASVFLVSGFLFAVMLLSSNPSFSLQMVSAGPQFWLSALATRFYGLVASSGYVGVLLTLAVAVLTGLVLTNTGVQLVSRKFDASGLAALPGLVVGGCASCGVGLLGFLGLGGVLASLPFRGNGVRAVTALLLIGLMARKGDPESCRL
jgi:hypothetical protein